MNLSLSSIVISLVVGIVGLAVVFFYQRWLNKPVDDEDIDYDIDEDDDEGNDVQNKAQYILGYVLFGLWTAISLFALIAKLTGKA
mgnify:FL=1